MLFQVSAYDPTEARLLRFSIEGVNTETVESVVADKGFVVLKISTHSNFKLKHSSKPDVRILCIELGSLLRAGLSLTEALETLSARADSSSCGIYMNLLNRLLEGLPLSDALATLNFDIPVILIAAIKANERTGRIADALEEYAKYAGTLNELRRKMISAAAYPLMVVGFGATVALFLLGYVVPRFASVYDGTAASISGSTRLLLALGRGIGEYGQWLGAGAVIAAFLLARSMLNPAYRTRIVQVLFSVGPLKKISLKFQLARISASLGMLLRGGYDLPGALCLSLSLAFSQELKKGIEIASEAIIEGQPVSVAWSNAGLADGFARRILLASERTGNLSIGFETLSSTYERELETTLERASRLIEPLLLMLVAVLIGAIVILLYMPIFDLAGIMQ